MMALQDQEAEKGNVSFIIMGEAALLFQKLKLLLKFNNKVFQWVLSLLA